jgi:hypothetical protein
MRALFGRSIGGPIRIVDASGVLLPPAALMLGAGATPSILGRAFGTPLFLALRVRPGRREARR